MYLKIFIMKKLGILLLTLLVVMVSCKEIQMGETSSPNGEVSLKVETVNGELFYSINQVGQKVIDNSLLGFKLANSNLSTHLMIVNISKSSFSETWKPVYGEESSIENSYNELVVDVKESVAPHRNFSLIFRVFNNGVGFRYHLPKQDNLNEFVILDELTQFALAGNYKAWSISHKTNFYEGLFKPAAVSTLDTVCTPLTMEGENGLLLSIHEANLTDYAAMNLTPLNKSNTLQASLTPWATGEKVFVKDTRYTPWRTIAIAKSAGDLMLNRIMLNLNEPCTFEDVSYIKPGRYIGIWWGMHMQKYTWSQGPKHGATTAITKQYIDFAAKHNFDGVLVEGWNYGWEEWKDYKFAVPYPDFDIVELSAYAKAKGVKIIGHHETAGNTKAYESQLDSAFQFCNKYDITTVKTGYVGGVLDGVEHHNGQYGVRHYRKIIETAAKYKVNIDNHEPVMPTGLCRTYPNLMTQEGVRGQEWDAWSVDGGNPAEHTTIIPFTRGLAGPMDFTPGTFNFKNTVLPNTYVHTTLAKQLALSVIIYSPLQMASDMIENYENNPAFEFITSCPTDWAQTVVPDAKIGEYVTIARKDKESENWFVGSITNGDARQLSLPLSFLAKDKKYKAKIFKDGNGADYKSNPYPVDVFEQEVDLNTVLTLNLAPSGGTAIILTQID